MKRTRVVFIAIVVVAVVIVAVSLWLRQGGTTPVVPSRETIEVRILTALPVEPWVREAAAEFNQKKHRLEGKTIQVKVIPMDGLTAMGKWDRDEFGSLGDRSPEELSEKERERLDEFPTVWIPESRYLPELVNASYKEQLGRDVFLGDGEYRARPLAVSLFSWGIYSSRAQVLRERFGEINWHAIHDAATAKGGWPELGGQPEWGYFKLVVPNPRKNVGGLMAMVAAAGEYYGKTRIDVADVTNPEFQKWLGELMGAVTDFSSLGSYTVENLALFGYSMGDGGQLLESELLVNMAGILTRWEDPLEIVYPTYVTWFDLDRSRDHSPGEERGPGVREVPAHTRGSGAGGGPRLAAGQHGGLHLRAGQHLRPLEGPGRDDGGPPDDPYALPRSRRAAGPAALVRPERGRKVEKRSAVSHRPRIGWEGVYTRTSGRGVYEGGNRSEAIAHIIYPETEG